ncbi:MAG: DUF6502 family protein [Steroidobacteraceae bacterium]
MSSDQTRTYLLGALRRALRALSRLMIRAGIRFDEFAMVVQSSYVECAVRDLEHWTPPSRSRISALTGLTLRQVDHCIEHEDEMPSADPTLRALLVEVLHKWHTVSEYGGPYGIPLELELLNPKDRCLASLISIVNPDANPKTVLAELLRSGAVLRAGERRFRPVSRFLMMPDPNSPKLIERFGMTLSRLAGTLEYNLDPKHTEKRLDRRVHADQGLPIQLIPAFESYARSKAADLLLELDNWLAAQSEGHSPTSDTGDRVDSGLIIFLYIEPFGAEEPLSSFRSQLTPAAKP